MTLIFSKNRNREFSEPGTLKEKEPEVLIVWDIQRTRTGGSLEFKEPHSTLVATRACCENHNFVFSSYRKGF